MRIVACRPKNKLKKVFGVDHVTPISSHIVEYKSLPIITEEGLECGVVLGHCKDDRRYVMRFRINNGDWYIISYIHFFDENIPTLLMRGTTDKDQLIWIINNEYNTIEKLLNIHIYQYEKYKDDWCIDQYHMKPFNRDKAHLIEILKELGYDEF